MLYESNEHDIVIDEEEDVLFEDEDAEEEIATRSKNLVPSHIIDKAVGGISPINISNEVQRSFMEYAMSVIISRAIPDARDGLKFVHRRILYSMHQLKLSYRAQYKKSARIVGDVLGKYHPHGDTSVYDAMVRMAQNFSMRHPLIDGHGNFGSADGDSAAAMRYTEARMSRLAGQMVETIDKDTVDFIPNYDGSELEPQVLPTLFPNLLIQGTSGIAVGIATKIPPHNLAEIIDATIHLAKNPDSTIEDLTQFVHGPDFPTGGIIIGNKGIMDTYHTGRGAIVVRAIHEIESNERTKREKIVFTEIPYEIKKPKIIEKINQLINEKKILGIQEIRDESSREGTRLVVILKKDVNHELVLSQLFKHTELQTRFNSNMIALVKGEPQLLNLKEYLEVYLEHHREVTTRRLKYELAGFQNRIHILEGLNKAIQNIDEVIQIIRQSENDKDSKERLMVALGITTQQAEAIVNLRIGRLSRVHIDELVEEINKLTENIREIQHILNSHENLTAKICEELSVIREHFSDERRTQIDLYGSVDVDDESLIPREECAVLLTRKQYIKRIALDDIRDSRIKTKGGSARVAKYPDDQFTQVSFANSHDDVLVFDKRG